jgi:cobalt-zinc-cadmium efflux system outer membrane protein
VSPEHGTTSSDKETDSQTTALMQAVPGESLTKARSRFSIPRVLPGAETGEIKLPSDPTARRRAIRELYPVLPPLPDEPPALPGPAGRPYTLADLQQIAAANSPSVR